MEFNFYPWKLDIDVEKTKALYAEKTFAVDEAANRILISKLTKEQRGFLGSLGVDPSKIQVHKKEYDLSKEECDEDELRSLEVAFLLCGKFLSTPADQIEMYSAGSPSSVRTSSIEPLSVYISLISSSSSIRTSSR